MGKTSILVVDDEPKIIHLVREILTAAGYEVIAALNGERAIELAAVEQPNLILLDIVMGHGIDGYQVAHRLREFSNMPIIMLTARVRETDMLNGFEAGADDYLTKPFSAKELLARIKAVLKRSQHVQENQNATIECGSLKIDMLRHRVTRGEEDIPLTPIEFELLCELARHPNQVLVHEHLLTKVWGAEYQTDIDYLRAYIRYLRRKIEIDPSNPKIIIRCPGIGYSLVCPDEN